MSTVERMAFYVGGVVLTVSLIILIKRRGQTTSRTRRRAGDVPVDVLADRLKEAWAPYHSA